MANIVLKDKTENPITYEGIEQLAVMNDYAEELRFVRFASVQCYAVKSNSDETVTVQNKIIGIGSNGGFLTGFTDTDCKEIGHKNADGSYGIFVVLTLKTLTVGNTYKSSEIF